MSKYKIFTAASIVMILSGLTVGAVSLGLGPDAGLSAMTERVSETTPAESGQAGSPDAASRGDDPQRTSPAQYQGGGDPEEQARTGGAAQDRDASRGPSGGGPQNKAKEITQDRARAKVPAQEKLPPPPEDKSLTLDIPKMELSGIKVKTGGPEDEAALKQGALRVGGSGLPWQIGSNTYIAGHRMGYPFTGSWRVFYDLTDLKKGDEVRLTDAKGTEYTYEVFKKQNPVAPHDTSVAKPVPGKSVVTLQTCTLPSFDERIVVQAKLTEIDKK